jgi:hypothetical protein
VRSGYGIASEVGVRAAASPSFLRPVSGDGGRHGGCSPLLRKRTRLGLEAFPLLPTLASGSDLFACIETRGQEVSSIVMGAVVFLLLEVVDYRTPRLHASFNLFDETSKRRGARGATDADVLP